MDQPRQVGSDQIVDAVAALNVYGAPAIIIDMGTATTMSVVDENENYIGGVILPGIRVSVDSLVSRTAQLPRIALDAPKSVMGKNTIDCMKSGLAEVIIPHCRHDIKVDPGLLLKGLRIIYDKNVE